jgi:hypothetical protein
MRPIFKFYLFAFFLISDFALFAQDPNNGDGLGGDIEGDGDVTPAPAPINSKIILLVITAVFFAFYTYNKKAKRA